ncbi:unnamed protein product [Mytilus edulis]|uniref:Reverse transcriptase n=1 Tax=Mytilus edulis TaxID=6550 RepID=A0A8S3U6R1_MYTED|nr:unnamed protein product [Mytilus edulis]
MSMCHLDKVSSIGKEAMVPDDGGANCVPNFYIIDKIQHSLIIGNDFLEYNKANINYPTKTLNLYDGIAQIALISTRQNEAKTLKHIELPARQISIIPVKIPKQFVGKQIILEPSQSLQNKSIVGAACLVSSSTQQAVMQVINPNEDKVVLNRNEIVALISEIKPNSIQNWSDKTEKVHINNIEKGHKKQKQKLNIDLSEADLTNEQKDKLRKFVDKNRNVFATDLSEIGMTDVHFHEIDTGNNPPVSLPPHRAAPNIRTEIERQVEEMLKYKIIEPSNSIWHSPVCLTRKKDNSWRFCVDYRRVNAFTSPMHATLGNMHDVFDTMGEMQPQIFSSIDLSSSFWQVPLHPNSKQKAAFVTHSGIYEWNRMPYGLRNSSIAFSQVMSQILRGLHWKYVLAYIDDILIFSKTFEEHLQHLEEVFARLRKANFTLKPQKCHFAVKKVNYLGHIISKDGVKVDESKITIVKNYPRPKNQTEVRQFLGLCNYYRRFVKDYAKITVPLNNLLQKDKEYVWTDKCQISFESLQQALTTAPVLSYPDMSKPFILTCDASGSAIGYILGQLDENGKERVISYSGRALRNNELNWTITEKECLAVLEGITKNKVYLSHARFKVYTDHQALVWLHKSKDTNSRLGRWALELQNYDFEIIYKEGKKNTNADALSRIPYKEIKDEIHPKLSVNSLLENNIKTEIKFEYANEKPIIAAIENNEVDLNDVSDISKLQRECDQLIPLIKYLETGELPENQKEARNICYERDHYRLSQSGELIHLHRSRTKGIPKAESMIEQLVLPKCLRQDALLAYHDHNGHTGIKRTYAGIHLKYYWSGMYQEVYNYVTSCDKCQRSKQPTHHRPAPLLPLPIEDTLSRWHMDILTCLPKTKDGYQHLLLVVDSFSRWPECFPLKTQEATEIAEVLYNEVFSRFGAPRAIVSDRGANFCSKLIQALCELFEVQRYHTSSYHPQTNSTCERMNRTIAQTLRTLVAKDQSNWHKLIPSVMMALRMSTNTESTGYSPFQMLFGKEMNLPFDISVQPKDGMSKTAKNHLETLIDRLKIVKDIAKTSVENSQEKTKNRYDKKAEAPKFRIGDYVMLQSMKVPKGLSPKLHPKWDGPFYVINVGQNNTCKLRRCSDHKLIKSRIHTNRMKPYIDPRDHRNFPDIQRNVAQNNREKVDDIDDVQNDNIDRTQNDNAQMQQNDSQMQQNDETNDDDNDFIAEKLLAKKRRQGKNYYKVKWVGYKKTTWEPEENIGEGLLVEFYTKFTKSGTKRKRPTSLLVKQTNT